jgi:hypothetical protein
MTMEVRIRRADGRVESVDEGRFVDPRDAAAANEYLSNVRAGSVAIGDVTPRILALDGDGSGGGDTTDPDGWKQFFLPGPGYVRSMTVNDVPFTQSGTLPFQANTFFAQPGLQRPINSETTMQSNGVAGLCIPFGGPWWFKPIRLDIPIRLCFQPMLSGDAAASFVGVDQCGIGNLHQDTGIKLLPMAADGGDATIPATDTFILFGGYRARKFFSIGVDSKVYAGVWDGGANPNWINAGDTRVDQVATDVLVGWTPFLRGTQMGRYMVFHLPSDILNATGSGIQTLRGGDRLEFAGVTRFVGPVFVFNLGIVPAYLHFMEWT